MTLTRSHDEPARPGWWDRVRPNSLGWVIARCGAGQLVGFVNVAWDGEVHAFVLDTKVDPTHRRRGVATELVRVGADGARRAGRHWLHVDYEEQLRPFYVDACGFRPTAAGLIRL